VKIKRLLILGVLFVLLLALLGFFLLRDGDGVPFPVLIDGYSLVANIATGEQRRDEYRLFKRVASVKMRSVLWDEVQRLAIPYHQDSWVKTISQCDFFGLHKLRARHSDHFANGAIQSVEFALSAYPAEERDSPEYKQLVIRLLGRLNRQEYLELTEECGIIQTTASIPSDFLNISNLPSGAAKILQREIELQGLYNVQLRNAVSIIAGKVGCDIEAPLDCAVLGSKITIPDGKMTVRKALWIAKYQSGVSFRFSKDARTIQVVNEPK
jgi:hypothetical protein